MRNTKVARGSLVERIQQAYLRPSTSGQPPPTRRLGGSQHSTLSYWVLLRMFASTWNRLDLYGRKSTSQWSEERTTGHGPLQRKSTAGHGSSKLRVSFAQDTRASEMELGTRRERWETLGCRNTMFVRWPSTQHTSEKLRHFDTAAAAHTVAHHRATLSA